MAQVVKEGHCPDSVLRVKELISVQIAGIASTHDQQVMQLNLTCYVSLFYNDAQQVHNRIC